jgi:hypothetical protein
MSAGSAPDARLRKTLEQLRHLRELSAQRHAKEIARRRLEDMLREERHDACAKTICAGTFAERRRYRSDGTLRAQREEDQHQWEALHWRRPKREEKAKTTRESQRV